MGTGRQLHVGSMVTSSNSELREKEGDIFIQSDIVEKSSMVVILGILEKNMKHWRLIIITIISNKEE